ncbi:hypothetical protein L1887_59893 [Cichorium endivia]|nr:hypothetical protein L1887_59893 [Cichorium endivia]
MPDDERDVPMRTRYPTRTRCPAGARCPGGESGLTLNRERQYIRLRYMVINVLWRTQGANSDAMDIWRGHQRADLGALACPVLLVVPLLKSSAFEHCQLERVEKKENPTCSGSVEARAASSPVGTCRRLSGSLFQAVGSFQFPDSAVRAFPIVSVQLGQKLRTVLRVEDHESDAIRSELGSDYGKGRCRCRKLQQSTNSKISALWRLFPQALESGPLEAWGLSTALVMEGYDVVVINSFYGSNAFIDRFGTVVRQLQGHHSSLGQTGLSNSALVGEVIGLPRTGLGIGTDGAYRPVYMTSMVFMTLTIFIPVFAQSLPMLSAGEVLMGHSLGCFPNAHHDVRCRNLPHSAAPLHDLVRVLLLGPSASSSAQSSFVRPSIWAGQWAWRMPFALQWVWARAALPDRVLCARVALALCP